MKRKGCERDRLVWKLYVVNRNVKNSERHSIK